ncbi:972_t:CDS:2 [Entrophospora sp. SA101]|nr:972_t:CDS:2 [Entrophospora sp. SA101]CAJ0834119.1 3186_t:CDS:2 [Entrophospora sp. SA101]
MRPLLSTPLLNNPSYETNNNIVWLLTRLEKRINQMEQNRSKSSYDIYNLLGKLFTCVGTSQLNVERNIAELNKLCFSQN